MVGAHQHLNGSRDLTTSISRMIYHLSLATINLPTIFELYLHPLRIYNRR